MRLFIAINFNAKTLEGFIQAQNILRGASISGSFSRPENFHLTLVFLGEQPPLRTATVCKIMEGLATSDLELIFICADRIQSDGEELWWLGIEPNACLMLLQAELSAELRREGFELEEREFRPHLTLARRVTSLDLIDPMEILKVPISAPVGSFSLMLSEQRHDGPRYTELYRKSSS